ncbi:hypothetical protein CQ14_25935 [Bradyrhizobium lablabi]|uniref:Uncharacterized protein n=1 Tax=Bradyrhizobium lablabi TaxID=722472 RepID=A0A0R3MJC1_9BRAD|nr:hypothetical protein CQ14_25935 [Bradyrhizobium lablabi]
MFKMAQIYPAFSLVITAVSKICSALPRLIAAINLRNEFGFGRIKLLLGKRLLSGACVALLTHLGRIIFVHGTPAR